MKTFVLQTLYSALIVATSATSVAAPFSGGDDFDDNSLNRSFWGLPDRGDLGHTLTVANGRLEYTSVTQEGFRELPWNLSPFRYTEHWDVQVRVGISPTVSARGDFDVLIGLDISDGSNINFADVELRLARRNNGQIFRRIEWATEGRSDTGGGVDWPLTEATLRVRFDASTKVLSFYRRWEFDLDPYIAPFWFLLGSVDLDAPESNWGLNAASSFRIGIYGESEGIVVRSGEAYADDFWVHTGSFGIAPTITVQPQSRTVPAGSSVTFSVAATGTDPLQYRWLQRDKCC